GRARAPPRRGREAGRARSRGSPRVSPAARAARARRDRSRAAARRPVRTARRGCHSPLDPTKEESPGVRGSPYWSRDASLLLPVSVSTLLARVVRLRRSAVLGAFGFPIGRGAVLAAAALALGTSALAFRLGLGAAGLGAALPALRAVRAALAFPLGLSAALAALRGALGAVRTTLALPLGLGTALAFPVARPAVLPVVLVLRSSGRSARGGTGRRTRMARIDDEVAVTEVRFQGAGGNPDLHPWMLLRVGAVADRHLLRVLARGRRPQLERAEAGECGRSDRCSSDDGRRHGNNKSE